MIGARRLRLGLLASLCVLLGALLCVLAPALASAAVTHEVEPFSPLDGSGSGLTLREPQAIAIDEATGNVFVSDESRIAILGEEGGQPTGLMAPFEIPGFSFGSNTDASLAYDNSPASSARGTLYVYDRSNVTVKKYVRSPLTEKYELEGEFPVPPVPGGIFDATVSVDGKGMLYVSVNGSFATVEGKNVVGEGIFKYSPTGALVAEYDLTSEQPLHPGKVAVDGAGDLFVTNSNEGLYEFPVTESGEINPANYTQILTGLAQGVAIDPATNRLYYTRGGSGVVEYDLTSHEVLEEFGAEAIKYPGEIKFDSATGRIYVDDNGSQGNADVVVFGAPVIVPTTGIGAASNVTGTKATLNGSVNPEGIEIKECFFEWGATTEYGHIAPCKTLPPTDSEPHPVSAEIAGLSPNGVTYHYRLIATDKNGKERTRDISFATADVVATEAATAVATSAATLNGTVRPEGLQYTSCTFEYGPTSSSGFEKQAACDPPASELPPDFLPHTVAAALSGLQPNATYKFRLTATNAAGTLSGETFTFSTQGRPQIGEIRALDADQDSVTLEAKINPVGSGTSYRFEWGTGEAYGHSIPAEFDAYVGEGERPVLVTAKLSGLSAATTYHYRLTAHNKAGTSTSPDEVLETLDSCGLPDQRCLELVSPHDAGPVAQPGVFSNEELGFQAATAPGGLVYSVANGLPGTTKAASVLYHAERGASGWASTQLGAPILARTEITGPASRTSTTIGISSDLSCAVLASDQPLTSDAGSRLIEEAGGSNLYRRNPDGTYTAITSQAPENFTETGIGVVGENENVVGFSENCGKVAFRSTYRYPGVSVVGAGEALYEWDEGTLRSVGFVPDSGGETAVGAVAAPSRYAVSESGARVFFSAERKLSANPEEVGKVGLFVRENGTATRDLSLSETTTPDLGATFQSITPDGSRVFFTANAGLTHVSSSEGTDLYEYDLESDRLTDLTATTESGGAQAGYMLGTSPDGSHVYFEARGQLVPGQGRTLAENEAQSTYSIYGEKGGVVRYVGFGFTENGLKSLPETAEVSPDGRYLLFETKAEETGYASSGTAEAYLYDADATSDAIVCASCRQNGEASTSPVNETPLGTFGGSTDQFHREMHLVVHNGQALIFFTSVDDLAPGAVVGDVNLYEWTHGQVFRITTEPPGLNAIVEEGRRTVGFMDFVGASSDGTDLYFVTPSQLTWEQQNEGYGVYDARVGGGFAQPPAPPVACDPNSEASCQGTSPQSPQSPGAASALLNGPGNVTSGSSKPSAPTAKQPTRAQKLAKALKACHAYKARSKRSQCEKRARTTYKPKPKPKAKAKSHKTAQPRKGGK